MVLKMLILRGLNDEYIYLRTKVRSLIRNRILIAREVTLVFLQLSRTVSQYADSTKMPL